MTKFFKPDKNWKKFHKNLNKKKLEKVLKKHMSRATALNGKFLEAEIRNTIKGGRFAKNADLTKAIKGGSSPLKDGTGQLFNSITSRPLNKFMVFVGVLKKDKNYNIAETVHNGKVVKVTKKMRAMFFALWQASEGKIGSSELKGRAAELFSRMKTGWKPLRESTKAIIIPERRFIANTLKKRSIVKLARKNWNAAILSAFREFLK